MEDYAVYECEFTNAKGSSKPELFLILQDDDAHIAAVKSNP